VKVKTGGNFHLESPILILRDEFSISFIRMQFDDLEISTGVPDDMFCMEGDISWNQSMNR
jgi:hypothetical protein